MLPVADGAGVGVDGVGVDGVDGVDVDGVDGAGVDVSVGAGDAKSEALMDWSKESGTRSVPAAAWAWSVRSASA